MNFDPVRTRHTALRRAEDWLHARGSPRFHMLLIVIVTGAFGFLFSFFLLHAGVIAMSLLGLGMYYVVDWAERRLCKWKFVS